MLHATNRLVFSVAGACVINSLLTLTRSTNNNATFNHHLNAQFFGTDLALVCLDFHHELFISIARSAEMNVGLAITGFLLND